MAADKERLVVEYTIKLLPVVHQDLRVAKKWYNDQKDALGDEFKLEVNQKIAYIGEYPEHCQRKYKEIRQSLVRRFPYAIYYIVEEEKKRVVIFGILHTSRDPATIRRRK